jgi:hypothetical protein
MRVWPNLGWVIRLHFVKANEASGGEQGEDCSRPGEITHAQEFPHDEDFRGH